MYRTCTCIAHNAHLGACRRVLRFVPLRAPLGVYGGLCSPLCVYAGLCPPLCYYACLWRPLFVFGSLISYDTALLLSDTNQ